MGKLGSFNHLRLTVSDGSLSATDSVTVKIRKR